MFLDNVRPLHPVPFIDHRRSIHPGSQWFDEGGTQADRPYGPSASGLLSLGGAAACFAALPHGDSLLAESTMPHLASTLELTEFQSNFSPKRTHFREDFGRLAT